MTVDIQESPTAGLRFAVLARVSSEMQEKRGESLRTQSADMVQNVRDLGGVIAKDYSGQEHATPGHERKLFDQLLTDARKQPKIFDAVMVVNADRWSRDNEKSAESLKILASLGIRFFVGCTEYNLFKPEHVLYLGMAAVIGQFQAHNQSLKSIRNRIARALRGVPTSGSLPFGRDFDRKLGVWKIIEEKKAKIEEIARRYLAGESLPKLAREHQIDTSCLYVILKERCGTKWLEIFESKSLGIRQEVSHVVPPLLDENTIKAVRLRAEANKTFHHAQPKNRYLLSRVIFCAHCGGGLSGQSDQYGHLYYRHLQQNRVATPCPTRKTWIKAGFLDERVIRELFQVFGNPEAVMDAVRAATPNEKLHEELVKRQVRLNEMLAKNSLIRDKVLKFEENIPDKDVKDQLTKLQASDNLCIQELSNISEQLQNSPSAETVASKALEFSGEFQRATNGKTYRYPSSTSIVLNSTKRHLNHSFEEMSWQNKRALIEMVFGGKLPDGKRMGIFIDWEEHGGWSYSIKGHLVDESRLRLSSPSAGCEEGWGSLQDGLVRLSGGYWRSGCR